MFKTGLTDVKCILKVTIEDLICVISLNWQ